MPESADGKRCQPVAGEERVAKKHETIGGGRHLMEIGAGVKESPSSVAARLPGEQVDTP
jgi:hypothetical protein